MKTDSRLKSDTNQLQFNLKSDTCPAYPCPKSDSPALLAWCCCVGFCTTQQKLFFGLSQIAVRFYITVLIFNIHSIVSITSILLPGSAIWMSLINTLALPIMLTLLILDSDHPSTPLSYIDLSSPVSWQRVCIMAPLWPLYSKQKYDITFQGFILQKALYFLCHPAHRAMLLCPFWILIMSLYWSLVSG